MAEAKEQPIRRENDSMDDFEHLDHVQDGNSRQKKEVFEDIFDSEKDMINFSIDQSETPFGDPTKTSLLLLESERGEKNAEREFGGRTNQDLIANLIGNIDDPSEMKIPETTNKTEEPEQVIRNKEDIEKVEDSRTKLASNISRNDDNTWNILENLPKPEDHFKERTTETNVEDVPADNNFGPTSQTEKLSAPDESDESEVESEIEAFPVKTICSRKVVPENEKKVVETVEIAPQEFFRSIGIDAWFNPERLNPKVAALIYWRDTKKSGAVFGAILGVLLSLAYFSLISVLAYFSLLVLTGTIAFRIYKTVLQAVQKTSDGHPFKDILELDLTLPAEKVHEVADVAVAHANAAVTELRRLFLVEDFIDSMKFGVLLWCLTYVGSWFNGMTIIIIGVVALFTLPKVYETNKAQVDQNLVLVQGKINELTAKVKAAIPLGKKHESAKEE